MGKFLERKNSDDSHTNSVGLGGVFYYPASGIVNGTANGQRIGNQINLRNLDIAIRFDTHSTGDPVTFWRVIVGVWHDYQTSSPTPSELLEQTSDPNISPLRRLTLQEKKWTPLFDKRIIMQNGSLATGDFPSVMKWMKIRFSGKRLAKKHLTYSSSSIPNEGHFIFITNININVGLPGVAVYTRVTYTDA